MKDLGDSLLDFITSITENHYKTTYNTIKVIFVIKSIPLSYSKFQALRNRFAQ